MSVVMKMTSFGKSQIAHSMYAKGRGFVGAALLLRRQGGYEYVVLHLICQGVEILLKALLLAENYDKYKPKLRSLGHKLVRIASETAEVYHLKEPRLVLRDELASLEGLYASQRLRYGSGYDVLVDASTIRSERVLRRTLAVIRLVKRSGRFEHEAI